MPVAVPWVSREYDGLHARLVGRARRLVLGGGAECCEDRCRRLGGRRADRLPGVVVRAAQRPVEAEGMAQALGEQRQRRRRPPCRGRPACRSPAAPERTCARRPSVVIRNGALSARRLSTPSVSQARDGISPMSSSPPTTSRATRWSQSSPSPAARHTGSIRSLPSDSSATRRAYSSIWPAPGDPPWRSWVPIRSVTGAPEPPAFVPPPQPARAAAARTSDEQRSSHRSADPSGTAPQSGMLSHSGRRRDRADVLAVRPHDEDVRLAAFAGHGEGDRAPVGRERGRQELRAAPRRA